MYKPLNRPLSILMLASLLVHARTECSTGLLETLDLSKKNDQSYSSEQLTLEADSFNAPIAKSALMPTVDINTEVNKIEGADATLTFKAIAKVPLLSPKALATYQGATITSQAIEIKKDDLETKHILNITQKYFDVLLKKATQKAIYSEYMQNKHNHEETKAMHEAGLKSPVDILSAQSNSDLSAVALLKARFDTEHSIKTLQTSINTDLESLKGLSPQSPPTVNTVDFDTILMKAKRYNNSLRLAQNKAQVAEQAIKTANAGFMPTIHASVTSTTDTTSTTLTASATATYNIFNGFKDEQTQKQKSYEYLSASAKLDNAHYDLEVEVEKAAGDHENAQAQVKAAFTAIQSSSAQLSAIKERKANNLATELEVASAISQVSKAQQKFFESSHQLIITYLNLYATTGSIPQEVLLEVNDLLQTEVSLD